MRPRFELLGRIAFIDYSCAEIVGENSVKSFATIPGVVILWQRMDLFLEIFPGLVCLIKGDARAVNVEEREAFVPGPFLKCLRHAVGIACK